MQPNVVIIVVDALRVDRVSAFGGRELTPNIDDFAADSAVFTNAYSTINATDVAVTSIQTGRYPLSHGVVNHGTRVTDEEKAIIENVTQLPQMLSDSGYRTGKFGRPLGRWHRKGFDVYPSSMESAEAYDENPEAVVTKQGIADTLERIHPKLKNVAAGVYQTAQKHLTNSIQTGSKGKYWVKNDHVTRHFEEFVTGSEPFYSFIHLMDTHTPYVADPDLVKSYLDRFEYNTDVAMRGTGSHPESFDTLVENGDYPEIREKYYLPDGTPTTAITDAHYDASVTRADRRVGEIIDTLKESGEYDESLIVLLSDHGESLTEHGIYYDHHGLYDVSTHIPMIVRPPNGASTTVSEFVQITDIAPTVESYTDTDGITADGYSLQPVINGEGSIGRQYILAEEAHTQRRRMVRSDEFKLIYSLDGNLVCRYCDVQHAPDTELYDVVADEDELTNIAEDNAEKVAELRKYGDRKAEEFESRKPSPASGEKVTYDDEQEVEERLEALGYR